MKVKFPKEPDSFYKELRKTVDDYFKINKISKYGDHHLTIKYLILKVAFVFIYCSIYWVENVSITSFLFSILGILGIILAINISHDAIHGVAHSNKYVNGYFKIQMDFMGANSYVWRKRHQFGHHTYPNTLGKDPDLAQTKIVKILPKSKRQYYHRFQHLYIPILYAFYTINWIYLRDFTDFFSKRSLIKDIPAIEYLKLIVFKLCYVTTFILLPCIFLPGSFFDVFIYNFILHISASYFLTLALITSHVSEHSVFVVPDSNGMMPYSWAHHQIITTTDFNTKSSVITWLLGGFNHHIAHHLFPKISHIHYLKITPIIKELAEKYELKYNHENNIFSAYKSHYKLLKNNGKQQNRSY